MESMQPGVALLLVHTLRLLRLSYDGGFIWLAKRYVYRIRTLSLESYCRDVMRSMLYSFMLTLTGMPEPHGHLELECYLTHKATELTI